MKHLLTFLILAASCFAAADITVSEGKPVSFYIESMDGGPIDRCSFQWFKDGVAIVGAISSGYQIKNVTAADAGTYAVRFSNPYGSAMSDNGVARVGVPPRVIIVKVVPSSEIPVGVPTVKQ